MSTQSEREAWGQQAAALRRLYQALHSARIEVDGFDLDDVLLGAADELDKLAMPITVRRG